VKVWSRIGKFLKVLLF